MVTEHATNAVVKRGMDEMFMPTALQDLKQTKEHHDDLSKQIQAFGQQIGAPTPADHRQAHLDLGTALGLAIASIAGKGQGMGKASVAAQNIAQGQEDIRYANQAEAEQARRQAITQKLQVAMAEDARTEGHIERLQSAMMEHEQFEQEMDYKDRTADRQDEIQKLAVQKEDDRNKIDTTKNNIAIGELIRKQYDDIKQASETWAGDKDPATGLAWDDAVRALNTHMENLGLPGFPLLPKGETASNRIKIEAENEKKREFEAKEVDLKKTREIAYAKLNQMSVNERDRVINWVKSRELGWANYKQRGDHWAAVEEISLKNHSELLKADEAVKKAQGYVDAMDKQMIDPKSKHDTALKNRYNSAKARLDGLKAYADEVAKSTDQDDNSLSKSGADVQGYQTSVDMTKAAIAANPANEAAIRALFKSTHGGRDLPN